MTGETRPEVGAQSHLKQRTFSSSVPDEHRVLVRSKSGWVVYGWQTIEPDAPTSVHAEKNDCKSQYSCTNVWDGRSPF